ncbi:fec operon regulator FecR [compost metagenome]
MARPSFPLLGEKERQAPRALVEYALTLVGRIHRASPEAARVAEVELEQWRQASPGNAEAAATAQRIWNATETDALRGHIPLPPSATQERQTRRRILGMLSLAGFLATTIAGGRAYWLRPVYEFALRTGRAQTLTHVLPEGSTVDAAANTVIQINFYRDRRIVRLADGEAQFAVAHDEKRPFTVETRWGRVRVLGTVFTVTVRAGRMRVAVARGRVAVWSVGVGDSARDTGKAPEAILRAGETIEADAHGVGEKRTIEVGEVADWKQGWLNFRGTSLSEVVARWNDYLRQPLRLADDPVLRELRVTGRYQLRDPQAFLDSLPSMLPVRIARTSDGGAEIGARR